MKPNKVALQIVEDLEYKEMRMRIGEIEKQRKKLAEDSKDEN